VRLRYTSSVYSRHLNSAVSQQSCLMTSEVDKALPSRFLSESRRQTRTFRQDALTRRQQKRLESPGLLPEQRPELVHETDTDESVDGPTAHSLQ